MTTNDQMRVLCEAATEGPWEAVSGTSNGYEIRAKNHGITFTGASEIAGGSGGNLPVCIEAWSRFTPPSYGEAVKANFDFISAARTWVPQALTQLSEQAARVKVLEDALRGLINCFENSINYTSGCPDEPPTFASEWDYNAAMELQQAMHILGSEEALKGAGK